LTFIDQNRHLFTVPNVTFSGQFATVDVTLPFTPLFGMVDFNEKLCDAVIDYNQNIYNTGSYTFPNTNLSLTVDAISDTAFLRVEHNMVAPDEPAQLPEGIARMSQTHYWNVVVVGNPMPQGEMSFRYQRGNSNNFDYALMQGYAPENLHLLYRPNAASPWQFVDVTRTGSPYTGFLKTNHIAAGQYCLAVGDAIAEIPDNTNPAVRIYPNPTTHYIDIQVDGKQLHYNKVVLTDSAGKSIKDVSIKDGRAHIDLSGLTSGLYFVKIMDRHRQVQVERVIKVGE